MEWIQDYWYLIFAGLIAVMFLFSRRPKSLQEEKVHGHQYGRDAGEKKNKGGGHGCCH
jgi:hypothetical protein